jgi:hypothetical protein
MSRSPDSAASRIFDEAEVRSVLSDTFYRTDEAPQPGLASLGAAGTRKKRRPKADHYEIVCISMYVEDLARLDEKVAALKGRGHRRMTRSALIRYALDRLALDDVPRPAL